MELPAERTDRAVQALDVDLKERVCCVENGLWTPADRVQVARFSQTAFLREHSPLETVSTQQGEWIP